MIRQGLWNKTANSLAEKKHSFIKDCRIYGTDVVYVEQIDSGVFDPVTDRKVGGKTSQETLFVRVMLQIPIKSTMQDDTIQGTNSHNSFAGGYKLNIVDITGSIVAKVNLKLPMTMTGIYVIGGVAYRLKGILDNQSIGKLPLWNVVHFVKA